MSKYRIKEAAYKKIDLSDDLVKDINAPDTLKVIASVSKDGIPHAVYKGSIHVNDAGQIELYEIIESSQNNKNLVWSLWNDAPVVVTILTADRRSYEIRGVAHRAIVSGEEFEKVYVQVTDRGSYDLSTIWQIDPIAVKEETYKVREHEEEEARPHFRHLDRILA